MSRKRRDAATRAAISADVARFLGVMRAERALATEQRVFPHPRNWNRNKKKNKKKNKNSNKRTRRTMTTATTNNNYYY